MNFTQHIKTISLVIICLIIMQACSEKNDKLELLKKSTKKQLINDKANDDKIKAASFLFKYMDFHYSKVDTHKDSLVAVSIDELSKYRMLWPKRILDGLTGNLNGEISNFVIKRDIEYLKPEYIIERIDSTYLAWKNAVDYTKADFNTYCDYILPYRISNERIDKNTFSVLKKEFSWVTDSLREGKNIDYTVAQLLKNVKFNIRLVAKEIYPGEFSAMQSHFLKLGNCDDAVTYFVNIFRALGIPATKEYVPQWGNHHSSGHSWFAIMWNGKWKDYNVSKFNKPKHILEIESIPKLAYDKESMPKVYRTTYSYDIKSSLYPNTIDVTKNYKNTVNCNINIPLKNIVSKGIPVLTVFNSRSMFNIVAVGTKSFNTIKFKDVGANVIYFPGLINNDMEFEPITNPLLIREDGSQHFLNPSESNKAEISLRRKYPFKMIRQQGREYWLESMDGAIIESSNDSEFVNSDTLLVVKNITRTNVNNFIVNENSKSYKYARIKSDHETWLAELSFLNNKEDTIKGSLIYKTTEKWGKPTLAVDNKPLTFFTGKKFYVGYEFEKPQLIKSVNIQARNDNNHINIGDRYELMMWDNGWKSLKTITANDTVLHISNVPENSLLWLRNLTKGREELPFVINNKGKQVWPGQFL